MYGAIAGTANVLCRELTIGQLAKVAPVAQVLPIMRKRKWRVGRVSEFFPSNANLLVCAAFSLRGSLGEQLTQTDSLRMRWTRRALADQGLNINRGQEIRIRLRPANRETEFLPFESLVGTMLHELTHIGTVPHVVVKLARTCLSLTCCLNHRASGAVSVRGPHDAQFYRILDELTSEYEVNLTKGLIEADGFIGQGEKLGGRNAAPPANLRATAALAAERRRHANVLLGQGPRLLGTPTHFTG